MPLSRYRQIRCSHIVCVDRSAGNFSFVVYVLGGFEAGREVGLFQVIEISHNTVFPNKSAAISIRVAGEPYHLSPFIDSISFTVTTSQRAQILHGTVGIQEGVDSITIGSVGVANHLPAVIDSVGIAIATDVGTAEGAEVNYYIARD